MVDFLHALPPQLLRRLDVRATARPHLEALAAGCPVVAYGAPPGHARVTARRLEQPGPGRNPRTPDEPRAAPQATPARPRPPRPRAAQPAPSA